MQSRSGHPGFVLEPHTTLVGEIGADCEEERLEQGRYRINEALKSELVSKWAGSKQVVELVHKQTDTLQDSARAAFGVPAPTALAADGVRDASSYRSQLKFFGRVLTLRAAALLADLVTALNDSRLLTFAMAARGLLETSAAAAYHGGRVMLATDATIVPADYGQRLRAAVMGSRFDWMKMFTDRSRQAIIDDYDAALRVGDVVPAEVATNILTMLESLADRLKPAAEKARGTVLCDYSLLSDLTHPAAGSYMLFLAGAEPEMKANLQPDPSAVIALAGLLLPSVGYSAESILEVLGELEQTDELLKTARPRPPDDDSSTAPKDPNRP